jgi:tRNA (guanine37-N1)-methyltransferase
MRLAVVSLFPEMFAALERHGVCGRAMAQGLVQLRHVNPRDFALDRHRSVDDRPYGGGPGMVMTVEPLRRAILAARDAVRGSPAGSPPAVSPVSKDEGGSGDSAPVIYLSPQGRRFDHARARQLARLPALILLAGRYEGVDERLIESEVDEELSIGDYVLSGGELAAMVVIDAVARQLPGTLGHELSAQEDSFADGLLDCPHYTRPESIEGCRVPEVLLSGDHERIRRWRLKQSLGRTLERRPDLLERRDLTDEEETLLAEYRRERQLES